MDEDEYLDLVNEQDEVIGKKLRSEVHTANMHNFRVINFFIRNSRGELWIPRRIATKKLFPLGLDFSCAGHVQSGDSYAMTLKKEVMEELNIDTDKVEVRTLGKTTPREDLVCYAMNYEMRSDHVPDYSPNDFFEYFWLSPEALLKRIQEGDYAKTSLPLIVRHFYLNQKNSA